MPEEKFSPEASLKLISNMIGQAKARFSENGHLYLLWGWTVFACSIVQFFLMTIKFEYHYMVWMVTWLVFIYQAFYIRSRKYKVKVKGYADQVLGTVWLVFVIMMFLFAVLFGRLMGDQYYHYINPVFLALYGMPTILSGTILQFRPLIIGGVFCWVLAVCSTFISYDYQLLLLASAVLGAWIIPGYLMRIKYKKTQ